MIKLPGAFGGNSNKIYVGFNLGDVGCQISYSINGDNVETVSSVAGGEEYSIPTVLCKREGVNQWFYGKEAVKYAEENEGVLIDRLLSKAIDGEPVLIEGTNYQPISLLSLYIKRCLSMLTSVCGDKMEGILFTCEDMDYDHMEVLREAVGALKLKAGSIFFQSHMESYYHFMIHQKSDLWQNGSILFDYEADRIYAYRMKSNLKTKPTVVYIGDAMYPMQDGSRSNQPDMEYEMLQMDKTFTNIAKEACGAEKTVSVYLTGSGFSDTWMNESIKHLCRNYKVFQGNNLYSKGAVLGLLDRLVDSPESRGNIFLGNDKLTANIGMDILRQGDRKYFALLDAGVNWFDANASFDFYIEGGNYIDIHINSLIGGGDNVARMTMEDFSGKLSRIRARFYMENVKTLVVELEDLGLGDFRAGTHKIWREQITIA